MNDLGTDILLERRHEFKVHDALYTLYPPSLGITSMIKASLDTNESQIRAKIKELLKANRTDEEKAKIAENLAKMKAGRLKKQGKSPENDNDDDYFHKEKWKFGI